LPSVQTERYAGGMWLKPCVRPELGFIR